MAVAPVERVTARLEQIEQISTKYNMDERKAMRWLEAEDRAHKC